jgi:hypothetical protein
MNSNLSKKLLAMVMSTLFLASMGAIAAGRTTCPKGQVYDADQKCCVSKGDTTKQCVKK